MKYLLSILLLSGSVMAVKPMNIDMIDEVRTLEHDELLGEIRVTFWGNNRIYQMDESHSSIPCLEESYKSREQVALTFDQNERVIIGCEPLTGREN